MSQRKTRRRRKPLGHLTPEQLLVHRELELLRIAARRPQGGSNAYRRHARHIDIRYTKLEQARRSAA